MKQGHFFRPAHLKAFGRALRAARGEAGMTLDGLAEATGISKSYLAHIETARAPGAPSEAKLRAIARALGVEARELLEAGDWLRTPASVRKAIARGEAPRRGDGAIDLDKVMGKEEVNKSRYGDMMPAMRVPLINRVAAGAAGEFGDLSYPAGVADAYVAAPDLPELPAAGLFAVKVLGDSMMPEYREGEVIIVGPGEARDGEDCVVRLGEAENFATTFKRVFFERGEDGEVVGMRLVPLNPAHAERRVGLEEVTGVYPMEYRLVPRRGEARAAGKASEKLKG